jgi:adenylosuccinate lyase
VAQAFLAADAMLLLAENVASGLVVYPKVIEKRLAAELPFMATENILMAAVKRGGDRQELHERIRVHSLEAARGVKEQGLENDLLERIAADPAFGVDLGTLRNNLDPRNYTGRAAEQTEEFLNGHVDPLLARDPSWKDLESEALRV